MNIDWFNIMLLIVGVWFTIFGAHLLWKKGFVEKMREGPWKEKNDTWTEKEGHFYDKYMRGTRYFISGLILMTLAIWLLFF